MIERADELLFSQTGRYALRATLLLTERGQELPVTAAEMADVLDVPGNYLSKILHVLARQGILISERGPRGGFRLAVSPEELRLADIVGAVEPESLEGRRCLLGRGACSDDDPCPAHEEWRPVADRIEVFLHETTVAQLVNRSQRSARAVRAPARRRSPRKKPRSKGG